MVEAMGKSDDVYKKMRCRPIHIRYSIKKTGLFYKLRMTNDSN